jgi:Ca-activated chloride channel family protein
VLVAVSSLALAGQVPVFRGGVSTVAIYATVRDADGRLVTGLEKEAFQVLDNGRPAEIRMFSRVSQPLRLALMLDTSLSMTGLNAGPDVANRIRHSVLAFLAALRPPDQASLGTFGAEIAVGANWTNDRAEFERVLREEVWAGGGTPLWQAIAAAMTSLARWRSEAVRRVLVVYTDGVDTGQLPGRVGDRSGVERLGIEAKCMVYVVRPDITRVPLSTSIRKLAEITGGGYLEVRREADLEAVFARVADELRHQYLLGIEPVVRDGKLHDIEIRMTRPGLKASAAKQYVAEKQQ